MQINLNGLTTESINPATRELDKQSAYRIAELINEEDQKVALAVKTQLNQIGEAIDAIVERMKRGGRLIYMGAGTSGRLGVVDASECPPTYGVSSDLVVGLIAGGREAMFQAQENVEDSEELGVADLQQENAGDRTKYRADCQGRAYAEIEVFPVLPCQHKVGGEREHQVERCDVHVVDLKTQNRI